MKYNTHTIKHAKHVAQGINIITCVTISRSRTIIRSPNPLMPSSTLTLTCTAQLITFMAWLYGHHFLSSLYSFTTHLCIPKYYDFCLFNLIYTENRNNRVKKTLFSFVHGFFHSRSFWVLPMLFPAVAHSFSLQWSIFIEWIPHNLFIHLLLMEIWIVFRLANANNVFMNFLIHVSWSAHVHKLG